MLLLVKFFALIDTSHFSAHSEIAIFLHLLDLTGLTDEFDFHSYWRNSYFCSPWWSDLFVQWRMVKASKLFCSCNSAKLSAVVSGNSWVLQLFCWIYYHVQVKDFLEARKRCLAPWFDFCFSSSKRWIYDSFFFYVLCSDFWMLFLKWGVNKI